MSVVGKSILDALAAPFKEDEIEWRAQTFTKDCQKVLVLPYISARAAMNRLDEVLGLNWKDEYHEIMVNGQQAFQCSISIKIDNEWITRTDGAEASDIESVKGGYSNAFKRACVKFGIGRYLYDLPQYWLPLEENGKVFVKGKVGDRVCQGYVNPPTTSFVQQNSNRPLQQPRNHQQTQQQGKQQNKQQQPVSTVNQQQAIDTIGQLIAGLGIGENLVNSMLGHMGSTSNLRTATIEELKSIYHVLKPVHDFMMVCKNAKLTLEQVFYYAQIVLKHLKQPIQQIEQLFFAMNYDSAKEAINLVIADQNQKQLQAK